MCLDGSVSSLEKPVIAILDILISLTYLLIKNSLPFSNVEHVFVAVAATSTQIFNSAFL